MPAGQICSDDPRNVRQALLMHNFHYILPAIKLVLDWDVFFQSAPVEFGRRENVRSVFSSRLDAGVLGGHPRAK